MTWLINWFENLPCLRAIICSSCFPAENKQGCILNFLCKYHRISWRFYSIHDATTNFRFKSQNVIYREPTLCNFNWAGSMPYNTILHRSSANPTRIQHPNLPILLYKSQNPQSSIYTLSGVWRWPSLYPIDAVQQVINSTVNDSLRIRASLLVIGKKRQRLNGVPYFLSWRKKEKQLLKSLKIIRKLKIIKEIWKWWEKVQISLIRPDIRFFH